ncbi:MAG: DUF2948 family protein [Pseudomonadota bacterium]
MTDARFEDGAERALHLKAMDRDDLQVLSMLVQDAVLPVTEMKWHARQRRFALFLNRFRWEDRDAARRQGRPVERVQSVLAVEDVLGVATQGIDRQDADTVLSLMSVAFEPGEDGAGHVILTLAGDGAVRLKVEALEATLRDVTKPYLAPSGRAPDHPE